MTSKQTSTTRAAPDAGSPKRTRLPYYPGCTLKTTAKNLEDCYEVPSMGMQVPMMVANGNQAVALGARPAAESFLASLRACFVYTIRQVTSRRPHHSRLARDGVPSPSHREPRVCR